MRAKPIRAATALGFLATVIAIMIAVKAYHSLGPPRQSDLSALSNSEIESLITLSIQNAKYVTVRDIDEQRFKKLTIDDQAELRDLANHFRITSTRIRGVVGSTGFYEVCIVGSETICFGLSTTTMYLGEPQVENAESMFPYWVEIAPSFFEAIQRLQIKHDR